MDYYKKIKNKIIDNEVYSRVKDYSKERHKVITYYEIGKLLSEAGGKYGDRIIDEYSKKLVVEVGKKYNRRTLYRMKQFYNVFSDKKVSTLWTQLTWSHCRDLIVIKNTEAINYYISVSRKQNLSQRQLQNRIKNKEYERLPESTKNKLINKEEIKIEDNIKNPIIIRNNSNEEISEKLLQKLILEDITNFMKELGNGYSYIDNEYKIRVGDRYNYIDLLLYNIEFNCYVVVELKVTELKKEHIGQIEVYMNYIDRNLKKINQNKTIGIIICRENNEYIIKYSSDPRVISREYELINN